MSKATKVEAHGAAEKGALQQAAVGPASASDSEAHPTVKKVIKKKTLTTKKVEKRKVSPEIDDVSNSCEDFKSADIVADSDDEADYQLPAVP
jgi:hypothetical protein